MRVLRSKSCLGFVALTVLGLAQADDPRIEAQVSKSVVRMVSMEDAETAPPFGSDWLGQTGVLVSEAGHVITNAHLAERTTSIVAILADERRYAGTLVGTDSYSNLALFKLPGLGHVPPLRPVTDGLHEGDLVYAVLATADGERQTVKGHVLNARRLIARPGSAALPYIEIEDSNDERPIRGPVFDEAGKLVAFVTLQSDPGHKTGHVLAIAISDVQRIADDLAASGRVRRSRIGVNIRRVTSDLSAARGLPHPTGALVAEIEKGGPGERGGLLLDDIVLKVDSTVIRTADEFTMTTQRIRPGTRIELEVLGPGGRRKVTVATGELISGRRGGEPNPHDQKILRQAE
jgi:serine protease Do